MSDECDHERVEVSLDSPPEEPDERGEPYGPIVQRATCLACGEAIQRTLRSHGWGRWDVT